MLSLWHVHESLLGELVLLEVSSIKVNAALKHWNKLLWWILLVLPKNIIGLRGTFLGVVTSLESNEVENVVLAVVDHLVGDLDEQASHSLVGVVVSSDGVDHLNTIHQGWKGLFDGVWGSVLEWVDELLKSLEVLNVILGLVEVLGNSELKTSPLRGGQVDLGVWLSHLVIGVLRSSSEDVIDGSAVLTLELLGNSGKFSHSRFPVIELKLRSGILLLLGVSLLVSLIKGIRDSLTPCVEDSLELHKHLWWILATVLVLGFVFPLSVICIKRDVLGKTLQSFSELAGELVEN